MRTTPPRCARALPKGARDVGRASRTRERDEGIELAIDGGGELRSKPCGCAPGTTVDVRELFFNVPARRKFLRTEPTELAHIASLVTHYSLAHPGKTFRLTSGPAELLSVTPVATTKAWQLTSLPSDREMIR